MDEKAQILYEYEEKHEIPNEFRYTEFVEKYDCYMIKLGLNPVLVNKRYDKALKEYQIVNKENEATEKCYAVFEIVMAHNIKDSAEFAMENVDEMLQQFVNRPERLKKVGIKKGNNTVFLLQLCSRETIPDYIEISEENPDKAYFEKLRHDWLVKTIKNNNEKLVEETREVIAKVKNSEGINYSKEIKKKIKACRKFVNEDMNNFNFQNEDLSDTIFINCSLKQANFAYANLINAVFINCNLFDACFVGAMLNNCTYIKGMEEKVIDLYKKFA